MRILNRQRKEAEIAGIHQGDRVKNSGGEEMEIMTANRRISAASIIGNTVVREKWLSIGSF